MKIFVKVKKFPRTIFVDLNYFFQISWVELKWLLWSSARTCWAVIASLHCCACVLGCNSIIALLCVCFGCFVTQKDDPPDPPPHRTHFHGACHIHRLAGPNCEEVDVLATLVPHVRSGQPSESSVARLVPDWECVGRAPGVRRSARQSSSHHRHRQAAHSPLLPRLLGRALPSIVRFDAWEDAAPSRKRLLHHFQLKWVFPRLFFRLMFAVCWFLSNFGLVADFHGSFGCKSEDWKKNSTHD